ncbi:MAG TPA: YciI family protein [Mucilaginibacter sp.]
MNTATDYTEPHHVMLVFEAKQDAASENEPVLAERCNYYQKLKHEGKVLFCGNFWNQDRGFIILHISSAEELEEIIDDDPGLKHNIVELVRAMAFTSEEVMQYRVAV